MIIAYTIKGARKFARIPAGMVKHAARIVRQHGGMLTGAAQDWRAADILIGTAAGYDAACNAMEGEEAPDIMQAKARRLAADTAQAEADNAKAIAALL